MGTIVSSLVVSIHFSPALAAPTWAEKMKRKKGHEPWPHKIDKTKRQGQNVSSFQTNLVATRSGPTSRNGLWTLSTPPPFVRSLARSLFPRECAMFNSVVHCHFLFFLGARSLALSFSRLTSTHSAPFVQAPASIPSFSRLVSRVPAVSSHVVMRLRVLRVLNSCNSVGLHVLATILPTRISPVVCRN